MHHGFTEIDVEVDDGFVIVTPEGAFNVEGVREYETQFLKKIKPLMGKTWGILNVYDTYETGGPDVQDMVRKQFMWSCAHGCAYLGFVVNNPLHEYAARVTTKDVEGLKEMRIFRDHKEALEWMRESISKANNT
ncbi:hypothetical protein NBRC116188_12440 [Oceaniserpentilla sp. 4NH20-0058]|uniref:hypothetical protein n=1 Tax=Oceaniserpentilla sp. 4NH20-0058 TaxID=3127660 RepID=UPI00310B1A32